MIKNCEICGNEFKARAFAVKFGAGRYCSRTCSYKGMIGHTRSLGIRHSPESIQKMIDAALARNPDRPHYQTSKPRSQRKLKSEPTKERTVENPIAYPGSHVWIRKQRGTPSKCDICGTTKAKRFDWHSINHEYKRELSNWQRLCVKCHNQQFKHHNRWKNP